MALWTPGLRLTDEEIKKREDQKRRGRVPQNSFFIYPKVSRDYDVESYESLQTISPRSRIKR